MIAGVDRLSHTLLVIIITDKVSVSNRVSENDSGRFMIERAKIQLIIVVVVPYLVLVN